MRGDFILVGDLMKSLSLLQCSGGVSGSAGNPPAIMELARDCAANWMTSVAFLDDDTYLGSENSLNLFVAQKNADATTDEVRAPRTAARTHARACTHTHACARPARPHAHTAPPFPAHAARARGRLR